MELRSPWSPVSAPVGMSRQTCTADEVLELGITTSFHKRNALECFGSYKGFALGCVTACLTVLSSLPTTRQRPWLPDSLESSWYKLCVQFLQKLCAYWQSCRKGTLSRDTGRPLADSTESDALDQRTILFSYSDISRRGWPGQFSSCRSSSSSKRISTPANIDIHQRRRR